MRILFQGGWKDRRDAQGLKQRIEAFCTEFARQLARSGHTLVLSSPRHFDLIVAEEVGRECEQLGIDPKEKITFLLADRYKQYPRMGRVEIFSEARWWLEERTHLVRQTDALVAIGGGKGTADCVQKALLSGKPTFPAGCVSAQALRIWRQQLRAEFHFIDPGDASFVVDLNCEPEEFARQTLAILDRLEATRYPRRIFVVHGHDHHTRDRLVDVLQQLDFDVVVLDREPSRGLTVIEKLERDISGVGFAFILYTPDDLGKSGAGEERPRARQNVLFEHGLLVGRLNRGRICALVTGDVEIPSDLGGVLYERINDVQRESIRIAQVLTEAGYKVDPRNLMQPPRKQ